MIGWNISIYSLVLALKEGNKQGCECGVQGERGGNHLSLWQSKRFIFIIHLSMTMPPLFIEEWCVYLGFTCDVMSNRIWSGASINIWSITSNLEWHLALGLQLLTLSSFGYHLHIYLVCMSMSPHIIHWYPFIKKKMNSTL